MRADIFLRLYRVALLVCVFLSGSVSLIAQRSDDLSWGRIVLIKPKGSLKVMQSRRSRAVKAQEGMLVRRGYVLILAPAARATVVCGDGRQRELAPGWQGCPCRQPCTPEVCGIRYDGSAIASTRGPDTDTIAFPVVISPRKTLLRNLRPTIRWSPIATAKENTTYNVTLYGESMKIIWSREVVSDTKLAYPEREPSLAPGQTYKVVVTSEGSSSQQDPAPGTGFTTLTSDQSQRLTGEESRINRMKLPDAQKRLLISSLYAARELRSEAIEELEELCAIIKEPALMSALGDLYATAGLNREAEKKYLAALDAAPATDFDRGLIESNLARVYENLGLFDRAAARLREAIRTYRRLRDAATVNALLKEERRLKKLSGL